MAWTTKKTLNFRQTLAFTTDNAGEVAVVEGTPASQNLPTYPVSVSLGGDTFSVGWSVNGGADGSRNRTANDPTSTDHRLAGMHFMGNSATGTFKIQLGTAAGFYKVWLAIHDSSSGSGVVGFTVRDSNGTLLSKSGLSALAAANVYDVNGAIYSTSSDWASTPDGSGTSFTFVTTDTTNGNGGPFLFIDLPSGSVIPLGNVAVQYLGTIQITSQPTQQSVASGSTATFSVTASGATSYQWNSSPTSQITVASEVQQSANYNSTTGTTETVTITVGAGASVDLYATSDSVSLPSGSVSSSPAATWTQRDSVGNTSTLLKHYTADGLSAGSYVITITWASAVAYRAMLARQITGTSGYDLAASAAHSANYQSSLGSTAADAITSGLTSTLSTQPALISGFTSNISSPTVTPVAGTGFTTFGAVWPQTNNTAIAEHKRITSTTALAATFTSPVTATTYTTAAAVFREGIAISGATSSSYTTGTLTNTNNGTVYSVDCTNTSGTTTSASVYLFIIGESSGDGDKINSAWFCR